MALWLFCHAKQGRLIAAGLHIQNAIKIPCKKCNEHFLLTWLQLIFNEIPLLLSLAGWLAFISSHIPNNSIERKSSHSITWNMTDFFFQDALLILYLLHGKNMSVFSSTLNSSKITIIQQVEISEHYELQTDMLIWFCILNDLHPG